jgi:hypothetical protein
MSTSPIFVGTPKAWQNQISAANTARDGSGTLVTIAAGGPNGSRISSVKAVAAATVTAGVVRLFLNDGTNKRLLKEILVPATTPSTSVETWSADYTFVDGLVLANGWSLMAATNNAETFNVFALGGDF